MSVNFEDLRHSQGAYCAYAGFARERQRFAEIEGDAFR